MNQIVRHNDASRTAPPSPPASPPEAPGERPAVIRPRPEPRKTNRLVLAGLGVVAVLMTILVGMRYLLPHPVELATVTLGPFQPELSGPGVLDALSKANVGSSLQGVITKLAVERNDRVSKGDPVAEIAADDLRADLDAAKAAREAARQSVEAAVSDVRRMEATAENARATLARQSALLPGGATSRTTFESAETAARQGEADLAKARSALLGAKAEEASAIAAVAASEAQLAKSVIIAPIGGVVVSRNLNLGDVAAPTSPIVTIADPASIVLSARFDESTIARIEPGFAATIVFGGEAAFAGTVVRVGREVDQETREFTVDIAPAQLPPNWALGQRGTAVISLKGRDDAIAVPVSAIARRDGVAGVWLANAGRAAWRPVELGRVGGGRVEILGGLAAGDRLIVSPDGVYRLMPVADERRPS